MRHSHSITFLLLIGFLSCSMSDAFANTIEITNSTDNDPGSLRMVIAGATTGDTITFATSTDMMPIMLVTEIVLNKDLVIIGNDSTQTIIDGMGNSRVFYIPSGINVAIHGVKLQHGNGVGVAPPNTGGAINNEGELSIANSLIIGNGVGNVGGGIYNASTGIVSITNSKVSNNTSANGGGVFNANIITIINSDLSSNTGYGRGGALYNTGGMVQLIKTTIVGNASATDGGGLYSTGATLTMTNCTLSGNTTGASGGGVYSFETSVTITNSTLSENDASNGAGLYSSLGIVIISGSTVSGNTASSGGGLQNNQGPMSITNSTVSGNTATFGGGIDNNATLTMMNTTIAGNSATFGGGIRNPSTMTITNSIVAKNAGTDINSTGTFTDGGNNLIGSDPLFIMDVPGVPSSGGNLRLQAISTAINNGNNGAVLTPYDQDGYQRIVDGIVDIGAHEYIGPCPNSSNKNFFVTSTADSGIGSLRDHVGVACAGDTIRFSITTDNCPINLITEITLDKDLVIIGNGATKTIIDGRSNSRIFYIPSGETVAIHSVTLQNGNGVGAAPANTGGAINNQGVISITNSTIWNNAVSNVGGGIFNNNTVSITNSSISGNTAVNGGGVFNDPAKSVTFVNTTISGNRATTLGGGIFNFGNATFTNTIIAKNVNASAPDIHVGAGGSITDGGYNLIGDGSGGHGLTNGINNNIVGLDPLFMMEVDGSSFPNSAGDLRLRCGSPAIDAGDNAANAIPEDLVGNPRKIGTIDIGAHERPADTGTKIVTTLADNGLGSLRDIVLTACPGDTITFDASLNMNTIKLTSGEITIDTNLVIIGNDSTNTIIDGMANSRIFHVPAGDTLVIEGMTIQNGNGVGAVPNNTGGAINNAGVLSIINAAIAGSTAGNVGGGIFNNGTITVTNSNISGNVTPNNGGGIFNGSVAKIINTIISDNSASSNGGGMYNASLASVTLTNNTVSGNNAAGNGGGVLNNGTAIFTNSTIAGNTANGGQFVQGGGGGLYNQGVVTFANSVISGNSATTHFESSGGGIYNNEGTLTLTNSALLGNSASYYGGGLHNPSFQGMVILTNCTISGNNAEDGGGLYNDFTSKMSLTNCSISGNSASSNGGGVYNNWNSVGGVLMLTNSIIAKNIAGSDPDISNDGDLTGEYNIIGDGSGQFTLIDGNNGNQVGVDPLFIMDVPSNNPLGGDLRLRSCSPARDAGDDSANMTTEDILGNPRKIDVIDIGAYERALGTDSKLVTVLADAGIGSLRYMVEDACPSDTIRFDVSLDTDTIKLDTEITLDKNLIIIGNDISNTIIDGKANSRLFQISQGDTVSIDALTIQNGNSMSDGGGILNQGKLTINEVALMSNTAAARGGGIYNNQFGTAAIMNVTISKNTADKGGGIYNKAGTITYTFGGIADNMATTQGGGVFNEDEATFSLISSSLFINSANEGGGMYNTFKRTTTISNSSIDSNIATSNGGGFYNDATAIVNFNMASFADNKAADGGAVFNNDGTATFMNMNIAGTGDGSDTSGVLSITGETIFKTTTVFSRDE